MSFKVAENIELLHDVGSFLNDDEYLGPWHDRDENEPPDPDDEDFSAWVDDLANETPEDRRALIALLANEYWDAHR